MTSPFRSLKLRSVIAGKLKRDLKPEINFSGRNWLPRRTSAIAPFPLLFFAQTFFTQKGFPLPFDISFSCFCFDVPRGNYPIFIYIKSLITENPLRCSITQLIFLFTLMMFAVLLFLIWVWFSLETIPLWNCGGILLF